MHPSWPGLSGHSDSVGTLALGRRDARHKAGHDADREETKMKRINLALLSVVAVVCASSAHAQDKYPSKPVKVMVPFGAGSATDIVIRIVGEQLRQRSRPAAS